MIVMRLITHLCCLFSTILGSLTQEMLYCHLYCNTKGYFCSSEAYWQKQPSEVFYKKGVLTNFSKFTGKHLCQGLLFKRLYYRFFPVNFPKFLGPLFFTEHLWVTASAFRTMSNISDITFLWKSMSGKDMVIHIYFPWIGKKYSHALGNLWKLVSHIWELCGF